MKRALDIKSVRECNRHFGGETLHPQVSVINLERPKQKRDAVKFGFYAVMLIEENRNGCCCGRKYYDFSYATMVFLKPGEIFCMSENRALPDKGWLLVFHPDLLYRTSLKNNIENYTFFCYDKEESLHLSERETTTITCCFENIEDELHHAIDSHTATILSRHIELVFDYCSRFYERQFITRENKNKSILETLEKLLDDYIYSGKLNSGDLPATEYFSTKTGLSVAYFNDLLKFETGKTMDEYFQLKRLEAAKAMLLKANHTPVTVSKLLGYPNVQYFSLLFKKITGVAPSEYRYTQS